MKLDLKINRFIEQPQNIFYDDINRIPLEIIFDKDSLNQEGIDLSNYNKYSFITFKFSKETYKISCITFITINSRNIIHEEFMNNINFPKSNDFYSFFLNSFSSLYRTEYQTNILLDPNNNLLLNFNNPLINDIKFFKIDEFLSIGVNDKQELTSILLNELSIDQITKIFNISLTK